MNSLKEQYLEEDVGPYIQLYKVAESLGIDERGGGPEGLYYTHKDIDGEYLLRNLHVLIKKVIENLILPNK